MPPKTTSIWDAPPHVRNKFLLILARLPRTEDGCQLWPMKKNSAGYGEFHWQDPLTKKREGSGSHKISLELKLGRRLKEGHLAAHACPKRHHRACCAPEHLIEATQTENMTIYANPGETDYQVRRRELLNDVQDILDLSTGKADDEF